MTRTFDTGLSLAFRTQIRNGVADLLAPLLRANGGFLKAVVKLGGTLQLGSDDGEGASQLYTSLLGRSPALAIAIGDRDVQAAGMARGRNMSFVNVHVYAVNSTGRSLLSRVEADVVAAGDGDELAGDDTADQGIDVMLECAEELLTGQKLGAAGAVIKSLDLRREEQLLANNRHTLWQQVYSVGVSRTIDMTRGLTRLLLGIDTVIHPPGAPSSAAATAFASLSPPPAPPPPPEEDPPP